MQNSLGAVRSDPTSVSQAPAQAQEQLPDDLTSMTQEQVKSAAFTFFLALTMDLPETAVFKAGADALFAMTSVGVSTDKIVKGYVRLRKLIS